MNFINVLLIVSVLIFIIISIGIFAKRYKENKVKLQRISQENSHELQKSLEEEVRLKREEELKKLEAGDKNTIIEVLDRLFKSSKLAGWVKSQNFSLHNSKSISIIVNISGQEELVKSKKEITLKTGEVFTQNKHYLAIKKEYSEKVFQCAYKVVEEVFTNIPTLYKIYISEYITNEENEQICVLSMAANRDQYQSIRDKNSNNPLEKIAIFNAKYSYDNKNCEFQEVEPVEAPAGQPSLEKTYATKASSNTSFFGNTIIDPNSEPVNTKNEQSKVDNPNLGSETKISNLSGSMMFDRTSLNIKDFEPSSQNVEVKDNFDLLVDKFLNKSDFKVITESILDNDETCVLAIDPSRNTFLINISKSEVSVQEENIKALVSKIVSQKIENGIFISKGGFSLDSVQYAAKNSIELYDKEKLNKTVS